jgi:hypothetical protein
MGTNRTVITGRSRALRKWLVLCAAVGALLPVVGDAQAPTAVTLKGGLQHFGGGNFAVLTVSEVGPADAATSVTIEFLDAKGQRRGFKAATTLKPDKPVQLRVQIPRALGFEQLRPSVSLRPGGNFLGSRPIVVLEELEIDTLRVVPKGGSCAVRMHDQDTSTGSSAEPNCPGWDPHETTM